MQYEIFNRETGNLVDVFTTHSEALDWVRELLDEGHTDAVRSFILGSLDNPGHAVAGDALIALATTTQIQ